MLLKKPLSQLIFSAGIMFAFGIFVFQPLALAFDYTYAQQLKLPPDSEGSCFLYRTIPTGGISMGDNLRKVFIGRFFRIKQSGAIEIQGYKPDTDRLEYSYQYDTSDSPFRGVYGLNYNPDSFKAEMDGRSNGTAWFNLIIKTRKEGIWTVQSSLGITMVGDLCRDLPLVYNSAIGAENDKWNIVVDELVGLLISFDSVYGFDTSRIKANLCYKERGKKFSRYYGFSLDQLGHVVLHKKPFDRSGEVWDENISYENLEVFLQDQKVCSQG